MSSTRFNVCEVEFPLSGRQFFQASIFSSPVMGLTKIFSRNGSGKSPLLNMLRRHHKPISGVVMLEKTPLDSRPPFGFPHQIDYAPKKLPGLNGTTVYDNVSNDRYPSHGDRPFQYGTPGYTQLRFKYSWVK